MSYLSLLFDLDGTLIDSRADLATSINLMLGDCGLAQLGEERIISFVGEGAKLLVERSLAAAGEGAANAGQIDEALDIFKRHYGNHLLDRTTLYPEVCETLDRLDQFPLAVVTNKPFEFTVAILEGFGLRERFTAVIGGDSLPERKPSPLMLHEAARRCNVPTSRALMIGDSRIDVAAGRNAGMATCGYTSGFRGRDELAAAGADYLIDHLGELVAIVGG